MERQTDTQTKVRSNCWSITAYNDDYNTIAGWLDGSISYPTWLKEVWGGPEECPTTGRQHQQICLVTTQVRFSAVKRVLPTARIERAIKEQALKDYVMKSETAIGEKKVVKNDKYLSLYDILMLCGKVAVETWDDDELYEICEGELGDDKYIESKDKGFLRISNEYLKTAPLEHMVILSNPQVQRTWKMYYKRIIARIKGEETTESISEENQV